MNFFKPQACKTIEEFTTLLQSQLEDYYQHNFPNLEVPKVVIYEGTKFYKIMTTNNSTWGFASRKRFIHKGVEVKQGDLMMAAGRQAAKHPRGNIIDGTACYGPYGPTYLK